jgi:hypothetical protein
VGGELSDLRGGTGYPQEESIGADELDADWRLRRDHLQTRLHVDDATVVVDDIMGMDMFDRCDA